MIRDVFHRGTGPGSDTAWVERRRGSFRGMARGKYDIVRAWTIWDYVASHGVAGFVYSDIAAKVRRFLAEYPYDAEQTEEYERVPQAGLGAASSAEQWQIDMRERRETARAAVRAAGREMEYAGRCEDFALVRETRS
jgi:hypothetical protein